jgi:hypothetical protein
MRKLFIIAAAIAALAIPTAAMATVAVDGTGTGFVGKGDVQTALGYANNNAFTDADARSAKFTAASSTTVMVVGVKCSTFPGGVSMPEDQHVLAPFSIGHGEGTVTTINASPKSSGGKVTGYNLTGIGTTVVGAATTPSTLDYSKILTPTTCPGGEHFAGWVDPSHIFNYVPAVSDLTVSIGTKSAALLNTPVAEVIPAV